MSSDVSTPLLHLPAPDAPRPGPAAPPLPPSPFGPAAFADGAAALAWVDAERANLVALVVHLADHGYPEQAWGLADLLNGYFTLGRSLVPWQTVAEAAARASDASGDAAVRAASEIRLGTVYELGGHYATAARHHTRAAELAAEAGWTACRAVALNNLARHHWLTGDVDTTIGLLTESLAPNRADGRLEGEAVALANLAVAYAEQGAGSDADHRRESLARSRSLLDQALALHRRIGDRRNEGDTLRCLAQVYRDAGDLAAARAHIDRALHMARESADTRFELTARNVLATIHARLGHGGLALEGHREALEGARQLGDRRLQAQILLDLADTQTRIGRPQDGELAVQDALAVARQINSGLLERQAERVLAAIPAADPNGLSHPAPPRVP